MRRLDASNLQRHTIDDFSGGINVDSAKPEPNEVRVCNNFNITSRGLLETRGGSLTRNSSYPMVVTSGLGPNALFELSARNTVTGVRTRHLLGIGSSSLAKFSTTGATLAITGLTTIKSGLALNAIPSTTIMQNKAFMVNGTDAVWTDGSNAYPIGIPAPTVAPTLNSAPTTGGYMSDGTYIFYYVYARSTNYGFYGCVSPGLTVTLSGGTATQQVLINCKASNSLGISADKIFLYRTKVGDTASWYKVSDAGNPDDNSTVVLTASVSDNSILDTNIYEDGNEVPPAGTKIIMAVNNRMYYADDNYLYYSKPNLPECVPGENVIVFTEDDGQSITGLGVTPNNVIVTKQAKTFVIDTVTIGEQEPVMISDRIGCAGHRTMQSILNGQVSIWLSQEGFAATDGLTVKNISENKILSDMADTDFANGHKAFATYYKAKRQYICFVPCVSGLNQIWVFSADHGAFTRHTYSYYPTCFGIFKNENDVERIVQGQGSGTDGYVVELDYGVPSDDGADISWSVKTPFISSDTPDIEKSYRLVHLEWDSASPLSASINTGTNGRDNVDVSTVDHIGAGQFDNPDHGFDDPDIGFDMSGIYTSFVHVAAKGNNFNLGVSGSDSVGCTLKSLTMSFRLVGERLYNEQ